MAFAVPRHRAPAGTAHLPEPGAATFALSDLSPGTNGRITRLLDDGVGGVLIKRLRNLGFVPGRIATPLRRAPMGDPVVYRVSDYELCLRRHEARLVEVTTVEVEDRIILQPRPAGRHVAADPAQTAGETL
ncbi:FeoA family protein [Actinomyces sp. ZJ308]|uniref:FeoA family protein n=1 Tax=Actinomyces sp. ZJ308 TaxID=2708342 RepID=UPI001422088E|nr:FeoA family protein [Actinomyces sp. ZJ308]